MKSPIGIDWIGIYGVKTARIWVFIHGAPVKISVKKGKRLEHCYSQRTDEGWCSEAVSWEWDGERLTSEMISDGTDCDGRLTRHWAGFTMLENFRVNPDNDDFQILYPCWTVESKSQRDYTAESMNY